MQIHRYMNITGEIKKCMFLKSIVSEIGRWKVYSKLRNIYKKESLKDNKSNRIKRFADIRCQKFDGNITFNIEEAKQIY